MKKVLSFVLVLSMILGSFGMAFATDYAGSDYEDAITMLTTLGVVEGYTDGTFKPEKVVTRAEAATMIIKAMDLQDYAVGTSAFTDMDQAKWAQPFVAYAASLGFVAGNTDGTFAPNAPVTSDQMITMLIQALGYKAEYLTGGYPGAFVNQAKALGMLKNVKSGAEGCTRGEVAQLIYNTLKVPFVRYSTDGVLGYFALTNGENDCMMERLVDDARTTTDVITGEETGLDLMKYQGAYAVMIEDASGDVVAIDEIKSVFLTGTVEATTNVAVGVKFVAEDDTEYTIEAILSGGAVNFVNGRTSGTAVEFDQNEEYVIAAKVSGKKIEELYSVALWDATGTIKWEDTDAEALADKFELGEAKFEENDDEEIDTTKFVLVGVDSLADIKEDDVVTYYADTNDYITKVEVSRTVVTGKITEEKADEVVINGKAYEVNGETEESLAIGSGDLELGDEGKYYLDAAGKIAFADTEGEEEHNFAVVVLEPGVEAGYDNSAVKVKLLTADGKKTIYTADEDYAITTGASVYATGTAVDFSLDKDGEIDAITKAALTSESGMVLTAKGYLNGIKVSANVTVFEFDEEGYSVSSLAAVPVNTTFAGTQYATNKAGDEVILIVMDSSDAEVEDDGVYGVVVSASNVINADDETIVKVVMLVDGNEKTYYGEENGLDKTDIPTASALYEIVLTGDELTSLAAVEATTSATLTVAAIKDGNLKIGDKFVEVADDVVVYEITEDGMVASSFAKIAKKDEVILYQVDTDDEDGIDVILFTDK